MVPKDIPLGTKVFKVSSDERKTLFSVFEGIVTSVSSDGLIRAFDESGFRSHDTFDQFYLTKLEAREEIITIIQGKIKKLEEEIEILKGDSK